MKTLIFILVSLLTQSAMSHTTTINDSPDSAVLSPLSPGYAAGLTFFAMLATIIGACIPLFVLLYRGRKFKSIPSDNTLAAPAESVLPNSFTASALSFAGVFGSLFDILPGAVSSFTKVTTVGAKLANLTAFASLLLGVFLFIALEKFLVLIAPDLDCPCHSNRVCVCEVKNSCSCAFASQSSKNRTTSWLTFFAMVLHHIPEGIVFFIAVTTDFQSGIILGLVLIIHVVPEGVAIGVTALEAHPNQRWRGPLYGFIAGAAQPIGALIGYLAFYRGGGVPSDAVLGVMYGLTSGMLLTISVKGLIPYARRIDTEDKVTGYGLFAGAAVIFFSISMFGVCGFDG